MNYYIYHQDRQEGPFDLVSIIRKIRKGNITEETLIIRGEGAPPMPALRIEELENIFQESYAPDPGQGYIPKELGFGACLKGGCTYLTNNQIAAAYSSFFLLLSLAIMLVMARVFSVVGFAIAFPLIYVLLGGYVVSVLRMVRGQPVELDYIIKRIKPQIKQLLLVGAILAIPTVLSFCFLNDKYLFVISLAFLIPMLFINSYLIFTPFLIVDKGFSAREAMQTSFRTVKTNGIGWLSTFFGLLTILIIFAPLAMVLLPIAYAAISEVYDETFYQ
jgi:hypothetical protein